MKAPSDWQPAPRQNRPADLTRGAAQFGIRPPAVWLEARVLEDYTELDPVIGLNAAGVILQVLSCRLKSRPAGEELLTICLARRADGVQVEVDLSARRVRHEGEPGWRLAFVAEHAVSGRPEGDAGGGDRFGRGKT